MVLLSESFRGGISSLLPFINKVLFLHHDINRLLTFPNTQLFMNFSPKCRPRKALRESKSFSTTNNEKIKNRLNSQNI